MNTETCCFDEEAPATLDASLFGGRRLLIAGCGGGADCVTAWALARWLRASPTPPASVLIANAKRSADVCGLEPTIPGADVYAPVVGSKRFFLDSRLHGGQACLILRSPEEEEPFVIKGLDALDFDHVLAVDTGADIVTREGRDWRTFQALLATGKPVTLALVCPGSDGQEEQLTLRNGVRHLLEESALLGHQPATVLKVCIIEMQGELTDYAKSNKPVGEQSTLMIALDAFDKPPAEEVRVNRDRHPKIPARWLQGMWFFDCTS